MVQLKNKISVLDQNSKVRFIYPNASFSLVIFARDLDTAQELNSIKIHADPDPDPKYTVSNNVLLSSYPYIPKPRLYIIGSLL